MRDSFFQKMNEFNETIQKQAEEISSLGEKVKVLEEVTNKNFSSFLEKTNRKIEVPVVVQVCLILYISISFHYSVIQKI